MSDGQKRLAIVDGGGANIASLKFALGRLGWEGELTTDADRIAGASHVILPGVGAARDAMRRLGEHGLDKLLPTLTQPVLGICLGMQLLFAHSEEDDTACLGVLDGSATRIPDAPGRPVPHMGWNRLHQVSASPLFEAVAQDTHFYFVHSYAVPTGPATLAEADYGGRFTAVAGRDNFWGTQFHPERSGAAGAALLRNFLGL